VKYVHRTFIGGGESGAASPRSSPPRWNADQSDELAAPSAAISGAAIRLSVETATTSVESLIVAAPPVGTWGSCETARRVVHHLAVRAKIIGVGPVYSLTGGAPKR
jgi:hypothetical protein